MRRWLGLIGVCLAMGLGAGGASPSVKTATVSDPEIVVSLLRGDVQLVGSSFPNKVFQTGVLALLRAKTIKLKVLTTREAAPGLAALKASGAQISVLPNGVRMTGSLVLVGNDTAILSQGPGKWYVMQGPGAASTFKVNLSTYTAYARPY